VFDVHVRVRAAGEQGNAELWTQTLAALRTREAGALLDEVAEGEEDVPVASVVSYCHAIATEKWGEEVGGWVWCRVGWVIAV
jgi:hypothetical protein